MKVLIVSQYFWPENFRINDLAEGLRNRGHEIIVLTGMPNYPFGRFYDGYHMMTPLKDSYGEIPIHRVPIIPRGNSSRLRLVLNYFSFAFSACCIVPFLDFDDIDLIFVFEPSPVTVCLPAILLKKLKNKPIFLWIQDLWPESLSATGAVRSKAILTFVERLVRGIYKKCDRLLIQSMAFAHAIRSVGADVGKVYYFPNSSENIYRKVKIDPNSLERKLYPDGFSITFAGNVGAAQDFNTILLASEILKRHTDIHLIILGDGRMLPWVKDKIREKRLQRNVHLLGRYPVESMPKFFAVSDALLVTLRKDPIFSLTIPSKIQSYLACAKPIIAALDGEGARVINEAQAGITCMSENPEALADAILRMYRMSRTEREIMGMRGQEYYQKHFQREDLLDQLEKWMLETKLQCPDINGY